MYLSVLLLLIPSIASASSPWIVGGDQPAFFDVNSNLINSVSENGEVTTNPLGPYTWGGDASKQLKMPQGCTCKQTDMSRSASDCEIFTCGCACDLNAGQCDLNCCCDSECSAVEIASFTECSDANNNEGDIIETCASRDVLESVNPKYPLKSGAVSSATLNNLLCVHEYNTEMKGEFFKQPSNIDTHSYSPKRYDYRAANTMSAYASHKGKYRLSDPVEIKESVFNGFLPLPTMSEGGICQELNAVNFGGNVEPTENSCIRKIPAAMSDKCGSNLEFDYQRFTDVKLMPDGTSDPGLKIYIPDNLPTIAVNGGDCDNALKSLVYDVYYDIIDDTSDVNDGRLYTVSNITARMEFATVDGSEEYFQQSFGVNFVSENRVAPNSGSGAGWQNAIVNRGRSGNPGYIFGKPVISGNPHNKTTAAANKVVQASTYGMATFRSADGSCDDAQIDPTGTIIGFGEDVVVGCTKVMTQAEYDTFCGNMTLATSMTNWLAFSDNMVGKFGNADPLDPSQWISGVETTLTSPSCEKFPTSINLNFTWSYVGSIKNPQARIMKAEVAYGTEKLEFTRENSQSFNFISTVSWTYHDQSSSIYDPPAPPIIFSVPYDVFYPFEIASPASPSFGALSWAVLGLLVSVFGMFFLSI